MVSSSYFYPGTDVLINHLDIRDQSKLELFERLSTADRIWEFSKKPIPKQFDFAYLKSIHQYIFQDVYPFAGQIRTTNIRKPGHDWFCDYNKIDWQADYIFGELRGLSYLKNLTSDAFAEKSAFIYEQINFMHPFREGNGRSTRIFFENLSKYAGYELDWSKVSRQDYMQAVIKAQDNISDLTHVFRQCTEPLQKAQSQTSLKDIIMQIKGYPSINNDITLDHRNLNQPVRKYRVEQLGNNRYLTFQLKNENRLQHVRIDDVPYMSQDMKRELLTNAAENIRPGPTIDRGMGK